MDECGRIQLLKSSFAPCPRPFPIPPIRGGEGVRGRVTNKGRMRGDTCGQIDKQPKRQIQASRPAHEHTGPHTTGQVVMIRTIANMRTDRLWPADERGWRSTDSGDGRQADRAPVNDPTEDPIPKINERQEARKQATRDVNEWTHSINRSV